MKLNEATFILEILDVFTEALDFSEADNIIIARQILKREVASLQRLRWNARHARNTQLQENIHES